MDKRVNFSDLQKLRAFFLGVRDANFREIPSFAEVDGQRTSIDKVRCLKLLRELPELQGDEFKNDNAILSYLRDPIKRNKLLGQFTPEQRIEFEQALEEKPVVVEATGEQASGQQAQAGQPPTGEPASTMGGGGQMPGLPGMSTGAAVAAPRRMIRIARAPNLPYKSGIAGGEGTGTAATNKAARLAAQEKEVPATAGRIGSGFQRPRVPAGLTNLGKNLASRANIFLSRNIVGIARTGLGAFAGGVLTGGNPLAMIAGGVGGATSKAWGGRVLNGSINAGVRISNQVSRGGLNLVGPRKRYLAFLLLLLGSVALFSAFTGAGTPPPGSGITPTPGPGGVGGNIASCTFTRSGSSKPIKSTKLISIFQEVAAKSGVPASVLASLAMHESETFTSSALDSHDAFGSDITIGSGCKYFGLPSFGLGSSPTGALGIMQVQPTKTVHDQIWQSWQATRPPGSINMKTFEEAGAYSTDGVRRGAEMIGKTADSLTLQDFCDVRTSAYLGAGVLISKNGGRPPTTGDEINKSVCSYYGSICTYGPYNYGEEAKADFQNCQPATPTPGGPPGTAASFSCPLSGPRIISCGSFMSDPKYNNSGCGNFPGSQPIDRGHCGLTYGCFDSSNRKITDPATISNSRRAHSIDVNGNASEPVYLPTINGQTVNWSFAPDKSYSVTDSEGGGYGNVFRASVDGDLWVLHLLHTNQALTPPPSGRGYQSGDPVTTIAATAFTHVHVNIGKNPSGDNGGTGWLNPEDLGMCTQ